MSKQTADIIEAPVHLKVKTAWAVLTTIVVTTVWLTVLIMKIHWENQSEHSKLMIGLATLNAKSETWITADQYEAATMWLAGELHGKATNYTRRELILREGLRRQLKSPRDVHP